MKRRNTAVWASMAVAACAVVLMLIYYFSGLGREKPPEIALPPAVSVYGPVSGGPELFSGTPSMPAHILTVNRETVQAVLKTIHRPDAYAAEYKITYHYGSGEVSETTNLFALGGLLKVITFTGYQPDMHYLTDGGTMVFWDDGEQTVTSVNAGGRGMDDIARLPTYESIYELAPEDITEASYALYGGNPFVIVSTKGEVYDIKWWISLETALMHKAELTENGSPAITVDMTDYRTDAPLEEVFLLPDGRTFAAWLEVIKPSDEARP